MADKEKYFVYRIGDCLNIEDCYRRDREIYYDNKIGYMYKLYNNHDSSVFSKKFLYVIEIICADGTKEKIVITTKLDKIIHDICCNEKEKLTYFFIKKRYKLVYFLVCFLTNFKTDASDLSPEYSSINF
jgi:hypothetical protein